MDGSRTWQYKGVQLGLSLALGLWYGVCVVLSPLFGQKHSLLTIGYFIVGWTLWFGLTELNPVFLFVLAGLYPQVFMLPPLPGKIVDAILFTVLSAWQQVMLVGGIEQGVLASQPDFEMVGEATTGVEAVALAAQLRPDVVLMDLRMAEMDGVAATAQIHKQQPKTPVLVLTTYESKADIRQAIEAGAARYLLKDTPRDELFAAIRAVAQGKAVLAPAVAMRLLRQK